MVSMDDADIGAAIENEPSPAVVVVTIGAAGTPHGMDDGVCAATHAPLGIAPTVTVNPTSGRPDAESTALPVMFDTEFDVGDGDGVGVVTVMPDEPPGAAGVVPPPPPPPPHAVSADAMSMRPKTRAIIKGSSRAWCRRRS
jgi:hypothetical protein